MPYKDPADRRAHQRFVRMVGRAGLPDLRYGKPSGFVVQGTSVEGLPVRPRWEATKWKVCAYCTHLGAKAGPHLFRGILASEHR